MFIKENFSGNCHIMRSVWNTLKKRTDSYSVGVFVSHAVSIDSVRLRGKEKFKMRDSSVYRNDKFNEFQDGVILTDDENKYLEEYFKNRKDDSVLYRNKSNVSLLNKHIIDGIYSLDIEETHNLINDEKAAAIYLSMSELAKKLRKMGYPKSKKISSESSTADD